jgi:long-chain acyl-CoA synthetase
MNLAKILSDSAAKYPERIAIKLDDFALNFELSDQVAKRVSAMVQSFGVEPGDRVALMLPNIPHFAAAYYGALRAGGVVVPLNVLNKHREIEFYLKDSGAKVLFVFDMFAAEAEPAAAAAGCECVVVKVGDFEQRLFTFEPAEEMVEREPNDTAVILYTSGTTGTPKGAELTHDNMLQNAEVCIGVLGMDSHPDEPAVIFGALPLFHSFGQSCGLNAAIRAGGMLTLLPRFEAEKALEIIERDRVTVFEGVPTMYSALLHAPDRERFDVSSLELCASGGAAMPVEIMREFEQAFGCMVLEGYGLSETSPVASFNQPEIGVKPGSIGTPIRGVELRVLNEAGQPAPVGEIGEIAVHGHNVMKGYWNRPDATAEVLQDGWLRTGDMGTEDEDGFFFIVDRKKDMIIRNGFNVYPREIEEVLYEHPAVREAAVVGLPHTEYGEEIGAAVILKPGATATPDDLREFVKQQVAAFKYPRKVWIVDHLPMGPTGKILKREIERPAL